MQKLRKLFCVCQTMSIWTFHLIFLRRDTKNVKKNCISHGSRTRTIQFCCIDNILFIRIFCGSATVQCIDPITHIPCLDAHYYYDFIYEHAFQCSMCLVSIKLNQKNVLYVPFDKLCVCTSAHGVSFHHIQCSRIT